MSAGFSDANSQTTTSTSNTDKRVTSGSGEILNLADAKITVSGQGSLNVTSANADLAKSAIASVTELARRTSESANNAAQALAAGSNAIAADVAASQEKFVATASGQKYTLYALVGVAALVLLPPLFKGSK